MKIIDWIKNWIVLNSVEGILGLIIGIILWIIGIKFWAGVAFGFFFSKNWDIIKTWIQSFFEKEEKPE